jgi:hypothetical protein
MKYAWMALLCAGSGVSLGQTVFSSAGSDADVTNAVNAFRASLGALNPNSPGSVGSGRREINWDAVPDTFSSPNAFPGDFLNQPVTPRARGAQFTTPGSHLEVSADSSNPALAPKDFAHIDPSYAREFREFSPERLFSAIGSTIVDVTFHDPGFTTPAFSSGFGAVFSDVDTFGSTFMEFYGVNGNLLRTELVPASSAGQEGFSFVGVHFDNGQRLGRVRIVSGSHALATGVLDNPGAGVDLVVMDDFIYGEPVVPAPATLGVLAGAGLFTGRRRRA